MEHQYDLETVYRQVDGIFALEGFYPTELTKAVRAAVAAGKITNEVFLEEFLNYVSKNKSPEGFLESRTWAC